MSGKRHRQKGDRIERELVRRHVDIGVAAERVPLSGAAGGSYSGDVDVFAFGPTRAPLKTEVKARANGTGFVQLERWLGDNDVLFLRRDRAEPLVVLPWATWAKLVKVAAGGSSP